MHELTAGRALASMAPAWVGAVVGVVLVVLFSGERYLTWLPVVMALCMLLAFAIQLALGMRAGLVARLGGSAAGALVVLAVATVVLLLVEPDGLHILS